MQRRNKIIGDTNNRLKKGYNIVDNGGVDSEDIDNNYWTNRLLTWWSGFSLRPKLLAIATLVVSLLMTGITFFALNSIQRDILMNIKLAFQLKLG